MSGRNNSRSISRCLMPLIVAFLALLHTAKAQNIGQDAQNIAQNAAKGVSAIFNNTSGPANYVMAILCMLAGILFVFFGYRLFRIVMFVTGAMFFAAIAYLLLVNLEPATGYQIGSLSRESFYLIIMFIAGIVGGFFAFFLWNVGIALLGFIGGAYLAFFIQGLKSGGLLPFPTGFGIFLIILAILGGILAIFFERFIIILATSIAGSITVFTGIDFFAQTGFYQLLQSWSDFAAGGTVTYNVTNQLIGMLVGAAILAVIGFLLQYRLWDPLRHGPNSLRSQAKYRA